MSVINYAIEIDSGVTGVTDTDYACVAGVIRLITGRPGYLGVPTYPIGEAGIATATLQARWFQGWLTKEGVGTAVRSVDPSVTGQYGVLSSFSFTMENSRKWWAWAETNEVWLANKPVKLYVVIDNVFYFQWGGVIREQPRTDTELLTQCIDSFKTVHKQIPPVDISETNYPDATDDAQSKSIPVCVGDIPYAEMRNVSGEPDYITLYTTPIASIPSWLSGGSLEYKAVPATAYFSSGSPDGISAVRIPISPSLDYAAIGAVGNQNYLFVSSGTNADTNLAFKIQAVTDNGLGTFNGIDVRFVDVSFYGAFSVSPTTFDTLYKVDYAATTCSDDAWFFKIAALTAKCIVSEKQISGFETIGPYPRLIKYDTDTKKESDFSHIAGTSDDGSSGERPYITLISKNITKDGDITAYVGVPPLWISNTPIPTISTITTYGSLWLRDRGMGQFATDTYYYVRVPRGVDWSEFDEVYLCADFERDSNTRGLSLEVEVTPLNAFGQTVDALTETINYPEDGADNFALDDTYFPLNFIPNFYYDNGGNDNSEDSRFKQWETIGGEDTDNASHMKLSEAILDAIKAGDVAPMLRVRHRFKYNATFSALEIKVRVMAFIGIRTMSVTDGSVFSRVRGELTGTDETNTVYNAAKHILEDYDGIAAANIDYHNLATSRGDWHVGRQLTDKKSSYDYLRELCAQAFFCIIPKRNGNRRLTAWRDDNDFTTLTHDESAIQRNSLRKLEKSQISRVYNVFKLRYAWHPGRSEFVRSVTVDKVDEASFPAFGADVDGDGIDDWKTYVGGLADSSYADAKALWDIAHASYLRSSAINELPQNLSVLSWFTDYAMFKPDTPSDYLSTGSSAFKTLRNFVEWTTRQFDLVEYSIPVNATNVALELLKPLTFNDSLLTNGVDREGWITVLKLDPKRDRITVESLLQPADISTDSIDGDIVETGDALDTIDESGSRTDTITEGA